MRSDDLSLQDLLRVLPDGGRISLAGFRFMVLDTTTMAALNEQLVQALGPTAAQAVLGQVGYLYGWWLAEAMKHGLEWDNPEEWALAGTRIGTLCGLFRVEALYGDPRSAEGCTLNRSIEAEQQLASRGRSESPVCCTISGLLSGYLSRAIGEEIVVSEDRCVARGDAACHFKAAPGGQSTSDRADEPTETTRDRLEDSLLLSLQRVRSELKTSERTLRRRRRARSQLPTDSESPGSTVANSVAMSRALAGARRAAQGDGPILLTGEGGVGKHRIARLVHALSRREAGPFVAGRCGEVSELLLESELFGHIRGAFEGAREDRVGLFEAAHRGTLLLDEIAEAPPKVQVRLLEVMETGEIQRVGEQRSRRVDVRLIASTTHILPARTPPGSTRTELLRRLQGVKLYVPALRERREDILPLARLMLAEAALSTDRPLPGLSPAVIACLTRYSWPGNERELDEAMRRVAATCAADRVEVQHLPVELCPDPERAISDPSSVLTLDEIEREYILAALSGNMGNQTRTAKQLGIGTATLYRKLRRYDRERGAIPSVIA